MNKRINLLLILSIIFTLSPSFGLAQSPLPAGSLIRAQAAGTIYYLDDKNQRHPFPNEKIFQSWYADFSGVITVAEETIKNYPLGSNITYRPGTRLIKIMSDPKVYALEPPNFLHWIKTEAIAQKLYGPSWAKLVDDLPDGLFTNYIPGNEVSEPIHPTGALIKYPWDPTIYIVEGGKKRLVTATAFAQNNFNKNFVITLSSTEVSYDTINELGTKESRYNDPVPPTPSATIKVQETELFKALPQINITSTLSGELSMPENRTNYIEIMNLKIENISGTNITLSSIKFNQTGTAKNQDMEDPQIIDNTTNAIYRGSFEGTDWIYFNLGLGVDANKTNSLTFRIKVFSPDKAIQLKIIDNNYLIIPQKVYFNTSFPLYTMKINSTAKPSITPTFTFTNTNLEKIKYNFLGQLNLNNCNGGVMSFNGIVFKIIEQNVTNSVLALKINDLFINNSGNQFNYGTTLNNCDLALWVILNNNLTITGAGPKINLQLYSISGTHNDGAAATITNLPLMSQDLAIIP